MFSHQQILFCHIPKTGGNTLRSVLYKTYGREKVFLIDSRDVGKSVHEFRGFAHEKQQGYKVVTGHGAEILRSSLDHPFTIIILRDPLELFLSQYYYLRISPDSVFLEEVKSLHSIEEYIEYSIEKGQDNQLCRHLSGSMAWLSDTSIDIPDMDKDGRKLLDQAKSALHSYDAVMNLANFDRGVLAISQSLEWKNIPLYRPLKINKSRKNKTSLPDEFMERLRHHLRFDIELYEYFNREKLDVANQASTGNINSSIFFYRQRVLTWISRVFL